MEPTSTSGFGGGSGIADEGCDWDGGRKKGGRREDRKLEVK